MENHSSPRFLGRIVTLKYERQWATSCNTSGIYIFFLCSTCLEKIVCSVTEAPLWHKRMALWHKRGIWCLLIFWPQKVSTHAHLAPTPLTVCPLKSFWGGLLQPWYLFLCPQWSTSEKIHAPLPLVPMPLGRTVQSPWITETLPLLHFLKCQVTVTQLSFKTVFTKVSQWPLQWRWLPGCTANGTLLIDSPLFE